MKESYESILNLRRQVYAEVARIAYEDADLEELETASYRLFPGEVATMREDIFRERAIAEEMLRLAMGMDIRDVGKYTKVTEGFDKVNIAKNAYEEPLVNVIKFACESCPERTFFVTNNCRKCMARPCTNVCPVGAVTMGKDSAVIDEEKCIRCGRCQQTCPYHAVVQYDRPCSSVCGVKAIENDEVGRAVINHDKCVACGRCITQCPFGAISDKTQIYQLVKALVSKEKIYAIVAPSFIGQFGPKASPVQIAEAIKQLGFEDVIEVGLGADMTTLHEAKEYLEKVPNEIPFMGTSCCYSWSLMIEYNFPEYFDQVSDSGSPMKYTAEYIKEKDPDAHVCFIGPCTSKKLEAIDTKVKGYVDFVITFEELRGMMTSRHIEPEDIEVTEEMEDASSTARGYAVAGGVADAVAKAAKEIDPSREIKVEGANSLSECIKMMKLAKAGQKNGYLLEGMACPGGCVAGMGTIASMNKVKRSLTQYMKESQYKSPFENEHIPADLKEIPDHLK